MTDALVETASTAGAEDLPPVALENAKAWELIAASGLGDRMKRALQRVAAGWSTREAARAEAYADHADLWRYCRRFELVNVRTQRIMDSNRRIAHLANELVEHRLVERPDDISTRDLSIASGIAQDKLAKYERWGQQDESESLVDAVGRIAERMIREGGRLDARLSSPAGEAEVSISGSERGHEGEVIDVTPSGR